MYKVVTSLFIRAKIANYPNVYHYQTKWLFSKWPDIYVQI